nr:kelch-like protein [Wadden Sea poxvirus]
MDIETKSINNDYIKNITNILKNSSIQERSEEILLVTVGGNIHAYNIALETVSYYFCNLLRKEKKNNKRNNKILEVKMLKYNFDSLLPIIEYAHTGELTIKSSNVFNMLIISIDTYIDFVKYACIDYIINNLNEKTVIEALRTGYKHGCYELYTSSLSYIYEKFMYMNIKGIINNLNYDELDIILKSDDINVPDEDTVLDTLIEWSSSINGTRNAEAREIAQNNIRTTFLSHNGVDKLNNWFSKNDDVFCFTKHIYLTPRKSYDYFQKTEYNIHICLNDVKSWKRIINIIDNGQIQCSTISIGYIMFLVGGMNLDNKTVNTVTAIDIKNSNKFRVPNMLFSRKLSCILFLNYRVYVIGGLDDSTSLNSVESWSPGESSWRKEPSLLLPRYNMSAVVLNGVIYVMGGVSENDKTVECLFPDSMKWKFCPSMSYSHFGACSITHNEKIYIIGGLSNVDDKENYKMVEVFNPITYKWEIINSLNNNRYNASVCELSNSILVMGGYINEHVTNMEMYDDDMNIWVNIGDMNIY